MEKKYARNNDFVFNEVDGELVMMNLENGAYVSLNESGKSIWHILETPKNANEIVELLLQEFEVSPEVCSLEVHDFLAKMLDKKLLKLMPLKIYSNKFNFRKLQQAKILSRSSHIKVLLPTHCHHH